MISAKNVKIMGPSTKRYVIRRGLLPRKRLEKPSIFSVLRSPTPPTSEASSYLSVDTVCGLWIKYPFVYVLECGIF